MSPRVTFAKSISRFQLLSLVLLAYMRSTYHYSHLKETAYPSFQTNRKSLFESNSLVSHPCLCCLMTHSSKPLVQHCARHGTPHPGFDPSHPLQIPHQSPWLGPDTTRTVWEMERSKTHTPAAQECDRARPPGKAPSQAEPP